MIDKRIKFDESYQTDDLTILYFTAPKEMLKEWIPTNDYPEAIGMEISLEFSSESTLDATLASVSVSPTRECGDNGTEDYDWYDVQLPTEEIEELIALASVSKK